MIQSRCLNQSSSLSSCFIDFSKKQQVFFFILKNSSSFVLIEYLSGSWTESEEKLLLRDTGSTFDFYWPITKLLNFFVNLKKIKYFL